MQTTILRVPYTYVSGPVRVFNAPHIVRAVEIAPSSDHVRGVEVSWPNGRAQLQFGMGSTVAINYRDRVEVRLEKMPRTSQSDGYIAPEGHLTYPTESTPNYLFNAASQRIYHDNDRIDLVLHECPPAAWSSVRLDWQWVVDAAYDVNGPSSWVQGPTIPMQGRRTVLVKAKNGTGAQQEWRVDRVTTTSEGNEWRQTGTTRTVAAGSVATQPETDIVADRCEIFHRSSAGATQTLGFSIRAY